MGPALEEEKKVGLAVLSGPHARANAPDGAVGTPRPTSGRVGLAVLSEPHTRSNVPDGAVGTPRPTHGMVGLAVLSGPQTQSNAPDGAVGTPRPTVMDWRPSPRPVSTLTGLAVCAFAAAALATGTVTLRAGTIYIPNGSFQSPGTAFVDPQVDSWQKTAKPFWYDESSGYLWSQLTGVFANTVATSADHIDNMDGNQAVFLFAVPQVGLFQDYTSIGGTNSAADHAFNAKFEIGKSYALRVGVIGGGGGMTNGVTLKVGLYYQGAGGNHVTVAATNITYSPEVFTNTTHFVDFAVTVPAVKPEDAWAGQQIGIELVSTVDPALAGGYWDLDRVRLTATIEIPNASFELPVTAFVDPFVGSWQKTPKPFWYDESGGYFWTQLTGAFANTAPGSADHIDNMDGNQAVFVFAVPEVGLFQDYDSVGGTNSAPEHAYNAVFEVGKAYDLSVGLIGGGGGMTNGVSLQVGLYYRDAAGGRVTVAATNMTYSPANFPTTTHFVDVTVQSAAVRAADPWAGKHIGIQLLSTVAPTLAGGYWDVDNVRIAEVQGAVLLKPAWTASGFGFALKSGPGLKFEVLASDDLARPASSWTSLGVVTNVNGTVAISDSAAGLGARYYQTRQVP